MATHGHIGTGTQREDHERVCLSDTRTGSDCVNEGLKRQVKKFLIKFGVSLLLLGLVLRLVDIRALIETLGKVPFSVFLLVVLGYVVGQLVSTLKWWTILRSAGVEAPFLEVMQAYFIGMFANCFGLGVLGGDVIRAVLVARNRPVRAEVFASVVSDRAHGLSVLSGIGLVAALLYGVNLVGVELTLLLAGVGLSFTIGWFIVPTILHHSSGFAGRFADKVRKLRDAFPRKRNIFFRITAYSLLLHLIQIALHRVIGVGLGVDLPWAAIFVAVPFVNILSSLPISWNGLGVRETAYIFFLSKHIPLLTEEQAVAVGAIWFFTILISSFIGGLVALFSAGFSLPTLMNISRAEQMSES